MPKEAEVVHNKIGGTLRSGTINEIGLRARLNRYRAAEKRLSDRWIGGTPSEEEKSDYEEQALRVCDQWLELVVDLACYHGGSVSAVEATNIRKLFKESIRDFLSTTS